MALTANRINEYKSKADILSYGVDGAVLEIFRGALVCTDSTGYAVPGADTANYVFAGMAEDNVAQTAIVTDGTNDVRVIAKGSGYIVKLPIVTGVTVADLGKTVYVADDENVDLVAGVSNNVEVGVIQEVYGANSVGVRI